MLTRVLADYNNNAITAEQWMTSSRKRLSQADKALAGMRRRTGAISDQRVAAQLRRFDRRRAQTLTAFNRLLGVVSGPSAGTEQQAQQLVNRRLRASPANSRRAMPNSHAAASASDAPRKRR
jgi:hypothetical protein